MSHTIKPRILPLAMKTRRYDLAAHAIVYAMLKVKAEEQEEQKNGQKKGATARQPKR